MAKREVLVYAVRHQHHGILYDRIYQKSPSDDEMKEICKTFKEGWTKVQAIVLELDDRTNFDLPKPVEEAPVLDAPNPREMPALKIEMKGAVTPVAKGK